MRVKKVIKRDGRVVDFDPERIKNAIKKAMISVNKYNEKTLNKVLRYVLRVINEKYDEENMPHVEDIQDIVEFTLVKFDLYEVAKSYILYRKEREKIRQEKMLLLNKDYLDEVDKAFSLNAIRLLTARYLAKDEEGKIIETPKQLFKRVAIHIVIPDILYDERVFSKEGGLDPHPHEEFDPAEWEGRLGLGKNGDNGTYDATWNRYHLMKMKELYDRLNKAGKMKVSWSEFFEMLKNGEFENHYREYKEYYDLMVSKKFLPNSPTLFNSGTRLGQLSACFVLDIDDDIDSIMQAAKDAAIIFKTGGGIGINYSKLRPEGDIVFSTAGVASGPVSFMRIIDVVTDVIKQGGRRRGANMGILEIWHPDIEKFITAKSTPGVLENFNVSVMVTPDFWEKYENGEKYPLINPRDKKIWKEVDAKQLFRLIAEMAWKTGDPGVIFMDNINKRNILRKGRGDIRSTNPCITGDTLIYTPRGIYEIRELENKETLICLDDRAVLKYQNGKPIGVYRANGDVVKTGRKPVIKLETEHGLTLRLTPDHRVRVAERVDGSGDGNACKYRLEWREAGRLREGDILLINSVDMWEDWEEEIDGFPLTWELGYIVGYTVRDGYVDSESIDLFFDKEKERDLAKKVSELIKDTLNIKPHSYVKTGTIWLRIRNKRIVDFFRKHGISVEGSHKRKIPSFVFKAPRRFILGFITGLWEADGTTDIKKSKNASIRVSSSSIDILEGLQHILLALGIPSKIYKWRREPHEVFHYITKEGEEKVYNAHGEHELVISRDNVLRMTKILKPLSKCKIDKLEKLREINDKKSYYKEYFLSKVVRISSDTTEEVYDILNIPGHHAFIANGIMIHNCGEEPLYPYESCNLGSINLYAFIEYDEKGNRWFNWDEYIRVIRVATRFLDNVIDVNQFPIDKIENNTRNSRKIGLGLMGLADTLFALRVPYNSERGFQMMKRFAEYLTYYSMDESVELAKRKGPFPLYKISGYPDGEMPVDGFYQREEWSLDWEELRNKIMEHGIRNAETTTIAPTGSISMIADTSSGIEPQFALVFEKRVSVGTFFYVDPELEKSLQERGLYNDRILKKISDNGGSLQGLEDIPEDLKKVFVVSYDIPWWDHVRAQAEITKWICAAVSKTINMPNWVTIDDVEKAYLFAYRLGAKGITIYRDGSKAVQVLVTPSQKKGKYILEIENNTLDMMKRLGIDPPVMTKNERALANATLKFLPSKRASNPINEEGEILEKYKTCPECGNTKLIYSEGCLRCLDCGWSLCTTS